jgi:hypothetical protein
MGPKKNYEENQQEINRLEKELNAQIEQDLKIALEKYKNFERLNHEKITPYFMKLVRQDSSQNGTLGEICTTMAYPLH